MKHIIAFSLYGDKPVYTTGAVKNSEIALQIYPDWICRFYVNKTVPGKTILQLKKNGAEIIEVDAPSDPAAMLWRYYCVEDPDVDVAIFRDCDSRLSQRDASAVKEWLKSGNAVHIMRDHPDHTMPIMGGLWGIKPGKGVNIPFDSARKYIAKYNMDQYFLADFVYPQCNCKNCTVHASFWKFERYAVDFPMERNGLAFEGESIDENDSFCENYRYILSVPLSPFCVAKGFCVYFFFKYLFDYCRWQHCKHMIKRLIVW